MAIEQYVIGNDAHAATSLTAIAPIDKHRLTVQLMNYERLLQAINLDVKRQLLKLVVGQHRKYLSSRWLAHLLSPRAKAVQRISLTTSRS
jgi:hypothetical protein